MVVQAGSGFDVDTGAAEAAAEVGAEVGAEVLVELAAGGLGCRLQIWPVVPVV